MRRYGLLQDGLVGVAGGRTVGYAVLGDPGGRPVLWHHPTPGSRLEFDNEAEGPRLAAAGLRLIGVDRPGYGASDALPDRTVADAARDALAVLDALGVERTVNVGFSGGGPSALAIAALAPGRIAATAVVAGDGPVGSLAEPAAATGPTAARFAVRTAEDAFAALAAEFGVADGRALDTDGFVDRVLDWYPAGTREQLADPATRRRIAEPGRQGLTGAAADYLSSKSDWGFDVADVRGPVTLYYGTTDTACPAEIGRWLADRIPGAALRLLDADHPGLDARLVTIMSETREHPTGAR